MSRNQLEYRGKLAEYQQKGSQFKGSSYHKIVYTERQNYLYNRLIHGLAAFPEEEIAVMKKSKQARIVVFHRKAQRILNEMKQKRIVALSDHVFNTFFPKSPLAKSLVTNYRENSRIISDMKFEPLKISKKDIIDAFIEAHLLPNNFYKQTLT